MQKFNMGGWFTLGHHTLVLVKNYQKVFHKVLSEEIKLSVCAVMEDQQQLFLGPVHTSGQKLFPSPVPIYKVGQGVVGTNGSELVTIIKRYDYLAILLQKREKI